MSRDRRLPPLPRGRVWATVLITTLIAPAGSVGVGAGLARWADATTGGMAGLAAGVSGLIVGGPILAFTVYAVCLVTLLRPVPLRRWIALLVMLATIIVEPIAFVIGLRIVGDQQVGLLVVALVMLVLLGAGAYVGIVAARRESPATAAD